MITTPESPSREDSVERFCQAASDALAYIGKARQSLDEMEARLRGGEVPDSELETVEFEFTGLVGCVRTAETWYAYEAGRSAQEHVDVKGFLAEFEKVMNDGSLGAHNARAIMSMTPASVVEALLARVAARTPVIDGWSMQPFEQAVAARLAQMRPVPASVAETVQDTDGTGK